MAIQMRGISLNLFPYLSLEQLGSLCIRPIELIQESNSLDLKMATGFLWDPRVCMDSVIPFLTLLFELYFSTV